jgi:hypothetical protein
MQPLQRHEDQFDIWPSHVNPALLFPRDEAKLIAAYRREAYPADSVKYWVRERNSGRRDPPEKKDSKRSLVMLVFSGYGLLALDILPKGCRINSGYLCGVVLQRQGWSCEPLPRKLRLKRRWSLWIIVKFTSLERPRENWKSFRSHECPIPHALPTFRLVTSDFSAGAKKRRAVKYSTVQRVS